jgi:hypothetical protein
VKYVIKEERVGIAHEEGQVRPCGNGEWRERVWGGNKPYH